MGNGLPKPGAKASAVARNVRLERANRGWSAEDLAVRTQATACPIPRSIIANLENGRRADVSVDELAAFAAALGMDPWSLTTDEPLCAACRNSPPAGYACVICQRSTPPEVAS